MISVRSTCVCEMFLSFVVAPPIALIFLALFVARGSATPSSVACTKDKDCWLTFGHTCAFKCWKGQCANLDNDANCNDNNECSRDKCVKGDCQFVSLTRRPCNAGF